MFCLNNFAVLSCQLQCYPVSCMCREFCKLENG